MRTSNQNNKRQCFKFEVKSWRTTSLTVYQKKKREILILIILRVNVSKINLFTILVENNVHNHE